jgi:S-layer family protein
MKYSFHFLSFLCAALLFSNVAFAAPTMSSIDNKTFDENSSSSELYDITITDDTETPAITAAYGLKLQIPEALSAIYDAERIVIEIDLYGDAVDAGKIASAPEFSFEDGDKTLVIPVLADFEAGESFSIRDISLEGFNATTAGVEHLTLLYSDTEDAVQNEHSLRIDASSNTDRTSPSAAENFEVTQVSDTSVKLTWTDPTDLDLFIVEVLRGINIYPVSGTSYEQIAPGIQEYTDEDLEIGDTVKYMLRGDDGINQGDLTEELSYTMVSMDELVVEEPVEEVVEEPVDEEVVEEEVVEEPVVEETPFENPFEDIDEHWASAEILKLAEEGIVTGVSEISFNPDGNLNRAEASAVLYRVLGFDEPTEPEENPFSDVSADAWYAGYVSNMKALEMIHGYGDDTYRPGNNISRAEFIKLALEVYYYVTSDEEIRSEIDALMEGETTNMFRDLEEDWYTPYVTTAGEMGFVSGYACDPGRCFGATKSITRAEATVILNNIFIDYLTTEDVVE